MTTNEKTDSNCPTEPHPTLETVAGPYLAFWQRKLEAEFAFSKYRRELTKHGYTEEQVREAAQILPYRP